MADTPFRVLLDLTDLHVENFKYVWINVSPRELKTISDFKTYLLQKINIERQDIRLFVRDGLLLEQETIIVLREDDTVKVQYEEYSQSLSNENSGKDIKKFSRKRNYSECNVKEGSISSNKRRYTTESEISKESNETSFFETNSKTKKKPKKLLSSVSLENVLDYSEVSQSNLSEAVAQKKKNYKKKSTLSETNPVEDTLSQNFDSFFTFDAADTTAKQCGKDVSLKQTNDLTFDTTKNSSPKTNGVEHQEKNEKETGASFTAKADTEQAKEDSNGQKRKRKRHRKRKQTEQSVVDISASMDDKFISFSDNVDGNSKGKHIIYSPDACEKDTAISRGDANEVESSQKGTFVVNKNLSKVEARSFHNYPKVSTPTQSDGCGEPNWQVSLMQSKNSLQNSEPSSHKKDLMKEMQMYKPSVKENTSMQKIPDETEDDNFISLNSVPEIGTHIMYKTLELDENYSPTITEYREGIVKHINPDTEEIEIELLKHIIKPGRTGKFENLKEGEIPSPEVKRSDILKWSAIISPKYVPSSPLTDNC